VKLKEVALVVTSQTRVDPRSTAVKQTPMASRVSESKNSRTQGTSPCEHKSPPHRDSITLGGLEVIK